MKNLIIIFILALCATMANAQVKVLGKIEPNGPTDTYPTHVDSLGRGGFMAVKTWQERNNIPLPRRKAGMMVSVKSATVDSLYRLGVGLTNADWLPYAPSADVSGKANLTGGNTFTGTQTIDGNVGIGLTNPSSKFHVRLGTDKNILFRDNGSNSEIVSVNNAFNNYKPLNFAASEYYFNADIYAGIHSINAANLIGDVTGNLNGTATNWGPLNFSYINEGTIPTHFLVSENIDNGVIKYSDVGDVKTALSISLQDVTDFGNTTNNKLVTSNSIEWGTGTYEVGKSKLYNTASDGTILTSKAGSALDFTLTNGSGSSVFEVPHGTIDTRFYGNITASATGSNIRFDPSLTNPSGIYQSGSGDNILYFGNYANSNKALVVNPANGNIGAGTTDPNAKLHIRQGADKNVLIRDNGTNSEIISLNDAQTSRQPLGFSASLFDFTDGNMQLTGNVPTFTLQGTQGGAKTYALTNGITGVSNTGFAIRNTTDKRNDFYIDGNGSATLSANLNVTNNISVGNTVNVVGTSGSILISDGVNASTRIGPTGSSLEADFGDKSGSYNIGSMEYYDFNTNNRFSIEVTEHSISFGKGDFNGNVILKPENITESGITTLLLPKIGASNITRTLATTFDIPKFLTHSTIELTDTHEVEYDLGFIPTMAFATINSYVGQNIFISSVIIESSSLITIKTNTSVPVGTKFTIMVK